MPYCDTCILLSWHLLLEEVEKGDSFLKAEDDLEWNHEEHHYFISQNTSCSHYLDQGLAHYSWMYHSFKFCLDFSYKRCFPVP